MNSLLNVLVTGFIVCSYAAAVCFNVHGHHFYKVWPTLDLLIHIKSLLPAWYVTLVLVSVSMFYYALISPYGIEIVLALMALFLFVRLLGSIVQISQKTGME